MYVDFENNEEDQEKESISSRDSSISGFAHLSPFEINQEIQKEISQCLKLNAENKINHKNAFHLRMINFLIYSLRNENPVIKLNLNKASACLDASVKIYAFRVDKVHSELMKVSGSRGEKRKNREFEEEENTSHSNNNNKNSKTHKRRKNEVLATSEELRGNLESFNPISLVNCRVEAQVSYNLLQLDLSQHTDLNHCILDSIKQTKFTNVSVSSIDNFSTRYITPSFHGFKFLSLLSEHNELEDEQENLEDTNSDNNYNFELQSNQSDESNDDLGFNYDEKGTNAQNFKEFNLEAEYPQLNQNIEWIKFSNHKIKFKNLFTVKEKYNKGDSVKEKSDNFRLVFNKNSIKKVKEKFIQKAKIKKLTANWEEVEILDDFPDKQFSKYFLVKNNDFKNLDIKSADENCRDNSYTPNEFDLNLSKFLPNNSLELSQENTLMLDALPSLSQNIESFTEENFITAPKFSKKMFVPYSQRAKKINMRLLKDSIKSLLETDNKNSIKEFSEVYKSLKNNLPKQHSDTLSPSLAFLSLLDVAHEKNFIINNVHEFCDLEITNAILKI